LPPARSPSNAKLIDRISLPKVEQQPPAHEMNKAVEAAKADMPEEKAPQLQPQEKQPAMSTESPPTQSDASSNVREKGTGKKLPNMFESDKEDTSARGYTTDSSTTRVTDGDKVIPGKV
jgi:hypothetical protein